MSDIFWIHVIEHDGGGSNLRFLFHSKGYRVEQGTTKGFDLRIPVECAKKSCEAVITWPENLFPGGDPDGGMLRLRFLEIPSGPANEGRI